MPVSKFSLLVVMLLTILGYSATASADSNTRCWYTSNGGINGFHFGTVTPGQSASTTQNFSLGCTNYTASTQYFRMCLNLTSSSAPLSMTPNVSNRNNYPFYFNIYAVDNPDSPLSANSQVYAQFDVSAHGFGNSGSGETTTLVTLIAKILSGQNNLMATDYYNYNFGGYTVKYAYATSNAQLPSCAAMPSTLSFSISDGASADTTVKNGCAIAQVSDMDFGVLSPVNSAQLTGTATSTVTISCPVNTTFSVALGNGLYSQQAMRNMCDSTGSNCIPYQLYQDAAHTQLWNSTNIETVNIGNDTTRSLTVYGLVPNQDWPPAGSYTDTVIVNLSY